MTIGSVAAAGPAAAAGKPAATGTITANGWYEGEEIYYLLPLTGGIETGVTQRGENDLYLIGGDRAFQGNVAEFIPGEAGYTPHPDGHALHTPPGQTHPGT